MLTTLDEKGDLRVAEEVQVGKETSGNPQKLGHPTLTEGGRARIGGELRWGPEAKVWRANNKSGRYTGHGDRGPDQLRAAVDDMKAAGIEVGTVTYKDMTPRPQ